jgi:Endosomal/lysosomal potassium channel TMEM175
LHALLEQWPSYLAYAVSFLYIGVVWLNHHSLFSRLRRMNLGFCWINLGILFTTAILPFPTAVLASALAPGNSSYDQRVAVTVYALVAAAMSASWLPVFPYLRDHPELLVPTATAELSTAGESPQRLPSKLPNLWWPLRLVRSCCSPPCGSPRAGGGGCASGSSRRGC